MYNIGDRVVYPMHGAGIIEAIEEKEILGKRKSYYVMKMPVGEMTVSIPTDNVDNIGIRNIIEKEDADKVFNALSESCKENNLNWSKRYRENMIKIKSGNVYEVAEVVKSLMYREHEKGLSTGEKKMLNSAKQILISELVLAKNLKPLEVEKIIEEQINY